MLGYSRVFKIIIGNYVQMDLQCLECAGDLRDRILITRLGDIDVWFCDSCEVYYDKKEIKEQIFCP
jgi:hypothetical protein